MMTVSEVFADGALAGRVVLVTGGGAGLGKAAAAELRRCGADVVICGRREEVLAATAAELDLAAAARTVPLQRLGREAEHAWLVALCCSPLGAALSGSVVTLDGGRDNWFGPWPPESLTRDGGEVQAESRGPKPLGS